MSGSNDRGWESNIYMKYTNYMNNEGKTMLHRRQFFRKHICLDFTVLQSQWHSGPGLKILVGSSRTETEFVDSEEKLNLLFIRIGIRYIVNVNVIILT